MEKVRVGVIGLGQRGFSLSARIFPRISFIEITAVCDFYEDRVKATADAIVENGHPRPFETTDYKELLNKDLIDCVVVTTSWKYHTEVVTYCMEQGIPVGSEVGGAYSLDECWNLVKTYEKTKTPYMFMENCNYGRRELMALNMVQQGVLGEIVHCSGCYGHDLREEISSGKEKRHYRLNEYLSRNCENYPSHELGPIMQVLGINRTNRLLTLTSTASKAVGLHEYCLEHKADNEELCQAKFVQGDVVTTVITCEGGQTIVLTLDTTLPRYYSRGFTVRGTKGMYMEENDSIFLDGEHNGVEFKWKDYWNNAEEYASKYEHPLWTTMTEEDRKTEHGGIDYLCYQDFFNRIRTGEPMPIDIYDAATMMCITPLSEQSIATGGQPVVIPNFKEEK